MRILGLVVALKRRHPYDVPLLHDRPDRVAENSVLMETRSLHLMERAGRGVSASAGHPHP